MTALAWDLKAWWALLLPEQPGRWQEKHQAEKRWVLGIEFNLVTAIVPPLARHPPATDRPTEERSAMADDRIPMTREGYDKLKAELDNLRGSRMIEVTKRVAAARDMGDLSENAEYHAAREDQGMLQARIEQLKDKLSRALLVDRSNLPADIVVFGSRVRVKDLDLGEEEQYELVGPGDEDYDNNKILSTSPIGKGLIGKKQGDVAEIQVPRGKLRYQILEISFA